MTALVRWDPFREMAEARHTMDRLFARGPLRPWRLVNWDAAQGLFPVDVYETDESVVVKTSLPGATPEDVHVSVTGDTLTIRGEAKSETEDRKNGYLRRERRAGAFQRSLILPVKVDSESAEAAFENGVLTLTLPKAPEVRSKTIEVKAAPAGSSTS